jgi:hypothetical protein
MSFMFETRFPQHLTEFAAKEAPLQDDYIDCCWTRLEKKFDGTPGRLSGRREDHQLRRDRSGALCLHRRGRSEFTGVIIGDDSVMIVEAQATPRLARKVIDCVRSVTDKPISHLVLTHYHAVRVLGASAYGAGQIIMSDTARAMVAERGQEDWDSEFARFPRLFEGHEEIPGLTWPTTTFSARR